MELQSNSDASIGHSNYLAIKNKHVRDIYIRFYEKGHRYEITICPEDTNSKYTSVTTWNHGHFPKFDADAIIQKMMCGHKWNVDNKYWGMTADEIKETWNKNGATVSQSGTEMHFQIECFMNTQIHSKVNKEEEEKDNNYCDATTTHADLLEHYYSQEPQNNSDEWSFFIQFIKDHPTMQPYRTEWTVFDETVHIAGSIDMVYQNTKDGTLSIYDWKRCKNIVVENDWNKCSTNPILSHIPDTNFWHYTLQLNTYKKILENKYGVLIRELVLVILHPDNPNKTYELIEVPILTREMEALYQQKLDFSKNDL